MASIIKRGPHQYQAQVRRKGYPTQTRTFETKRDAEAWVATLESEMKRGLFIDRTEAERTTFGEVIKRYAHEVTPDKRGWRAEISRLNRLQQHPLASRPLASLRSADFAEYRDERLLAVSPKTVQLELSLMSAIFNVAKRDWSIPVDNHVTHIRKPRLPRGRERRLVGAEEDCLLAAADESKSGALKVCIILAIETGMRRGEIVSLRWEDIDLQVGIVKLDQTKNGESRIVPLSKAAEAALRSLPRPLHGGPLTTFHDSNGLGAAFRRACGKAGIADLHFHDLRHEAASRLAPRMPVATLAKVMGWKTLQMAMRYYNPTARELVAAVRSVA